MDAKYNLPVPKYKIGQKVLLSSIDKISRDYMRKCILRHEIREARKFYNSMCKRHKPGWKRYAGKLQIYTKRNITDMMSMIRTAHTVEIAGIAPRSQHICGHIANRCYVTGGVGFGGVDYDYYLLFRALADGNELAYMPSIPLIAEHWLIVEGTP